MTPFVGTTRDAPPLVCAWCARRLVDGVAVGAPVEHDDTQSHGLCRECRDAELRKYEAAHMLRQHREKRSGRGAATAPTQDPRNPKKTTPDVRQAAGQVVAVSPRLARWFLTTTNHEPIQRPLEPERVARFVAQMRAGVFAARPPIVFKECDGALVLANGQHRLAAIAEGDATVDVAVTFG